MPNTLRTDPQAIADILDLHALANPRIIDLTYNTGKIYGRLPLRQSVIKCDAESYPGLDHVVAWQDIASVLPAERADVVIADPIQVDDQGSGYHGIYVSQQYPVAGGACPVADQFPSLLESAAYLLKLRGSILLVKMADGAHGNHDHPHGFLLMSAALERGWTRCQKVTVMNQRGAKKPDPRTIVQQHLPNQIAEWYVFRHDGTCRGPGRRLRYEKRCIVADCRRPFNSRRSDALVCSNACQKKLPS